MRIVACVFLSMLLAFSVFADTSKQLGTYRISTGDEELNIPEVLPVNVYNNELNSIGDTVIVGHTYYDMLQGGSVGRIIAMTGEEGQDLMAQITWMNTTVQGTDSERHAILNKVSFTDNVPFARNLVGGWTVDNGSRAGYPAFAQNLQSNKLLPVYHTRVSDNSIYTNGYAEELSLIEGVFNCYPTSETYPINGYCIWPKAAIGPDGTIHIVATESRTGNTDEHVIIYYRIPPDDFLTPSDIVPQIITTHGMNLSAEIEVSPDGNTVVIGQIVSRDYVIHNLGPANATQGNNDIYLYVSHDGGLNFDEPWNVTDFALPDFSLLPDTTAANTDTMRAYTDINLLIDEDDVLHLAYTANDFKYIHANGRASGFVTSTIYHWDDNSQVWCRTADGNFFFRNPGDWQSMACRPSMYKDPETDVLWMAYVQYGVPGDTTDIGDNNRPNGEIYLTASPPHPDYTGKLWATPKNITETPITGTGAPGECNSERDVSIARNNPGEHLNLAYILDKHPGCAVQGEAGAMWTNNPVVYHRVHKEDMIAEFDSWLPNYPMHVNGDGHWEDPMNYEWDGFYFDSVEENPSTKPSSFNLKPNYPNPFNPSTKLSFTLTQPGQTKLAVYDIQGREVAVIANQYLRSGEYNFSFNAEEFASGVYFARLNHNNQTQTRKMLLVK